jgi:hypothetical protein
MARFMSQSRRDALAYVAVRMPATYAAGTRKL